MIRRLIRNRIIGDPGVVLQICATVMLSLLCGCRPDSFDDITAFDGQRAYAEVEALVRISPRDAGTPNARKAAEHILQRLNSFGVDAEIDTFTAQTPEGLKTMHNVIGRIPGKSDRSVILGSHFDTMPGIEGFQGANDGGSSTGILLEIARMSANTRPDIGIIFAFFDGEEGIAGYIPGDGLHGSRHMADQLVLQDRHKKIRAMVLLDMVGDEDLHFSMPGNSAENLVREVLEAAHVTGHRDRFTFARNSIITDDHVPFLKIGIPAIDLIDFRYGSASGQNDYWHTPEDHIGHVSADSLRITGEVALQLIKQLTTPPKGD